MASNTPPVTVVRLKDTHRLIPSKFSRSGTVLSRLTDDEDTLQAIAELDGATNDRLLGEQGLLPAIGIHELVYGIEYWHIINASFAHASPSGGRFNSSTRGAWYAGVERETSIAEVTYHKLRELEEIDWKFEERTTYDDYLADFFTTLHDLRGRKPQFRKHLKAEPVPECYAEPQQLADDLLARQSNGIIYPSIRHSGGTCVVCFRPALVYHVRQAARLEFRLTAGQPFSPDHARELTAAR